MKINIPLPFDRIEPEGAFTTMEAVHAVGRAIEAAGFHAALVTDHPAPTGRWLDTGGHHAQGPFVMLALLAAVTSRIRLQTGILVLPYRNPFTVARDVATLDRFSNGRVTLSVGAGYLKGEYRAVGVDFDKRNELMDDYIPALRAALSGEEFAYEGDGYVAYGNRILPGPVQPRLPILIGGNARRAIRRAVEIGDGWNPFFTSGGIDTTTTRTASITGEADLVEAIAYMKAHCEAVGREGMPEIVLGSIASPGEACSPQQLLDRIGRYRELGVSAAGNHIGGRDRAEWCDNVERFGSEVIAKIDGAG